MHMSRWISASLLVFLLLAGGSRQVLAAPSVYGVQKGNTFTIYGTGLEQIGGISFQLTYDKTLTAPELSVGEVVSGTLSSSNVAVPGSIKFAAVNPTPFSRSQGVIATVKFGGGVGKVNNPFPYQLSTAHDNNPQRVDGSGEVKSESDVTVAGTGSTSDQGSQTTNQGSTQDTGQGSNLAGNQTGNLGGSSTSSSSGQGTFLGTVSMQTGDGTSTGSTGDARQSAAAPVETARAEQAAPPPREVERSAPEPESRPVEEKKAKPAKFVSAPSVLSRFKDYKGDRSPRELLALFAPAKASFKQIPEIFLADGQSVVKITIPVDPAASASPNFALSKDAKMASFPKIEEDVWVVQLKPNKGVYQAALSYFLDEMAADIPITVAPVLEAFNGKPFKAMTGNDLVQFLSKGTATQEKVKDLNGDEAVDYIDDYIFIANFLVQADQTKLQFETKEEPKPAPPAAKPAPAVKAPEVPSKKVK